MLNVNIRLLSAMIALLPLFLGASAFAQSEVGSAETARVYAVSHQGQFNGRHIRYRSVVEETILKTSAGKPQASIFTISYIGDARRDENRPVVFIYNGGPGSSSVTLNLAALAPRIVDIPPGPPPSAAAPYKMIDNDSTPLDVADLVFIDPVETGYSRILAGGTRAEFLSDTGDAAQFGRVIRHWLSVHRRWNAPKFLLGESYGTIRSALLARELIGSYASGAFNGVSLNGIMLVSQAINYSQMQTAPGNDIGYQLLLPSEAAAAWHHGKIEAAGRTRAQFLAEVEAFAAKDYAAFLFKGSDVTDAERDTMAGRLAGYIGLSREVILQKDFRVKPTDFAAALLSGQSRTIGVYDARYSIPTPIGDTDWLGDDPSLAQMVPFLTGAFNAQASTELGLPDLGEYKIINFVVNRDWKLTPSAEGNGFTYYNFAPLLGAAMRQNPGMRLLVSGGEQDLVVPFAGALHMVRHGGVPLDRTVVKSYDAGHSPYLGSQQRAAFLGDIRAFIITSAESK